MTDVSLLEDVLDLLGYAMFFASPFILIWVAAMLIKTLWVILESVAYR